jgi:hypothetical protein
MGQKIAYCGITVHATSKDLPICLKVLQIFVFNLYEILYTKDIAHPLSVLSGTNPNHVPA